MTWKIEGDTQNMRCLGFRAGEKVKNRSIEYMTEAE